MMKKKYPVGKWQVVHNTGDSVFTTKAEAQKYAKKKTGARIRKYIGR